MSLRDSQIMTIQALADAYMSEQALAAELRQARQAREEAERNVSRIGALKLREPVTVRAGAEAGTLVTVTKTADGPTGDGYEFTVSTLAEVL